MNDYHPYLIASLYIAGGFLTGFFFEKFILSRLKKAANATKWSGDELILGSFRGLVIAVGTVAGAWFAVRQIPGIETIKAAAGKVSFSLIVLLLTVLAARISAGLIKLKTGNASGLIHTGSIVANITRITVFVIGILVILQTLGVSITPLLTALGVGGLAVALALQDTLSNLFSGIQVIASRQLRTGDYIKLGSGEEGYVTDITWRNTTIRMLSNNLIVIPNSKIASSILTNYNLPEKEMSVVVEVGVSYDSDLEEVEKVTIETARGVMAEAEGSIKEFQPFIRYHTFSDSSVGFSVILRVREFTDQYLVKHLFVKALRKNYKKHSIEIPFPTRTVHLKTTG